MYELTEWQGQHLLDANDIPKITLDSHVLDENILKKFNNNQDIENDFINVEFTQGIKKADKLDYSFALFAGVVSYFIDKNLKGIKKEENLDLDSILHTVFKEFKMGNIDYGSQVDECLSKLEDKVKHSNDYVELAKDFCNEFSYRGLAISIIETVFNKKIGLDESNHLVIEEAEEVIEGKLAEKIMFGTVRWLTSLASEYAKTGKYSDTYKEVKFWGKALKELRKIVTEISDSAFKNGKFNKEELDAWFAKRILNDKVDKIVLDDFAISLNAAMVHSYVHIRSFIEQVKEHNVTSLKGLEIIDFDRIDNSRVITRLDTVSSGIFAALNGGTAVAYSLTTFALTGKVKDAVCTFAVNINIANCVRFSCLLKEDFDNIKEDIHEYLNKAKVVEIKEHKQISKEDLNEYFTLSDRATRILYSLELHMIEEDIQKTKESKDQILKNEWKEEWIKTTEEATFLGKVFERDAEKVYKLILTEASVKKNPMWLYNIAIELSLFKPYYMIDEENKYKKLKLSYNSYIKDIFCKSQNIIEYKDISNINKVYKKYCDYLDNSLMKKSFTVAGAVAVAAVTGGAAFAFAPEIAVAIFGGAFPTLHGAALTSACLAAAGGGSLAVGGLGMSGGAMIIAGGGALLGIGTTSSATLLISSPKFVKYDNAKLLTKCDLVLIQKLNMVDEVCAIQENTAENINRYKVELEYYESIVNKSEECKKEIKELNKSITYTERTNSALMKLIPKEKWF